MAFHILRSSFDHHYLFFFLFFFRNEDVFTEIILTGFSLFFLPFSPPVRSSLYVKCFS